MLDREKLAILECKRFYKFVISKQISPLFKSFNYKRKGNTWYKLNNDVYIQLKIKKSIHNRGREIAFKFYISMCLEKHLENTVEVHGDIMNWEWDFENNYVNDVRSFLTKERLSYNRKHFGWSEWYVIFRESNFDELLYKHLLVDFEDFIIPTLEKINNKALFLKIVEEKHKSQTFNVYDFVNNTNHLTP